jgi:opacity protein-like surface antigen
MKRLFIIFAAILTLGIPAVCAAASPRPGPYASGFIGVSIPQNTTVNSYNYVTGTPFEDRVEFNPGINIGGTVGYDYGFIRMEGELSYKHGEIATITDRITAQRFHNADGNLGALALMLNGFFDLHNASPITPYLGGGIGFATMHLSDTFVSEFGPPIYQQDDDSVFAYQVGGGLEVALTHRFSLDLGYRYFATTKARFGTNRDITTEFELRSHNAAVGFRVKF